MAVITASPKNMGKMIELQEKSLGELSTMREIMESGGATIEVVGRQNAAQEKLADATEDLVKTQQLNIDAVQQVADNFKIIKTPLEKMGDRLDSVKETLSDPARMGLNMLPNFLGGFKERLVQRNDFKKAQRALGSEASNSELNEQFKESRKAAKEMQKVSSELAKLSALTGLSESQLGGTKAGAALLERKEAAAGVLSSNDMRAAAAGGAGETKEEKVEGVKREKKQTELLEEIAKGVSGGGLGSVGDGPNGGVAPAENQGLLSSFGSKAGAMKGAFGGKSSNSMIKGAAALVILSGAVWIAADAMQKFADGVEWEDVGQGLVTLGGLTVAAMALGKAAPSMILGSVALGLVGGALWVAGEGMQQFQDLDWETIGKGFASIAGIGVLGAAAGTAAPLLIAGAAGLAALGGAAWIIGEAMEAIGEGLMSMVDGMERLSNLDGDKLAAVGPSLVSISGALALFGAGAAAAGLGNLVSGLLSIGQDTPIEQMEKLANMSRGLMRAGAGIRSISNAMAGFSEIDPDSMDALKEVPWGKMEDFADEDGVMIMQDGSRTYTVGSGDAMAEAGAFSVTPGTQMSDADRMWNEDETWDGETVQVATESNPYDRKIARMGRRRAAIEAANNPNRGMETERASVRAAMPGGGNGGGNTNVVNAPVTNNANNTTSYRPNVRNVNPASSGGSWWNPFD